MKLKLSFLLVLAIFALVSCKDTNNKDSAKNNEATYTCPMHPSVQSNQPGNCPVCNMSLVKVEKQKDNPASPEGNFVTISQSQQVLAGIQTKQVKIQSMPSTSTLLGIVSLDEEKVTTLTSPLPGRIEKLYFKSTGLTIRKGDPLYTLTSEQLLGDQNIFRVLALRKKNNPTHNAVVDDLFLASKNKLLLWGLTEKQILDLEQNKPASPYTIFYAKSDGYITKLLLNEGAYVNTGTVILEFTSLNTVWIDVQVTPNEIPLNIDNYSFQVFSESKPQEIYQAQLVSKSPSIEKGGKVQRLRLRIDNPKKHFIPGMMLVVVPMQNSKPVLAVPKSAVLIESMKFIWVLAHDNTFEQRMVEPGAENQSWIEILSGLKEGETIVTEGAYLVQSEYILKSGLTKKHQH